MDGREQRAAGFQLLEFRVNYGTLCAVAVSGYAQGYAAGEYARSILVGGKRPQDLPMVSTRKGNPMINLARARDIGIKLNSSTLLAAEVVTDYHWDR